MYHRIIPTSEAGNSAPGLVVSPEMFSAQLKALRDAGWQSITMATLADDMATDQTTYNFEDISNTGARMLAGAAGDTVEVRIGFPFQFYGKEYQ